MEYQECYTMILNNFKSKIKTEDNLLKIKIFNNLLKWYRINFEDDLKTCFENNNELGIITILSEIERVCSKEDYEKLKLIYSDAVYEEFLELSNKIFSLVKEFVNSNVIPNLDNLLEYGNQIEMYGKKMSILLLEKYNYYRSECILDLNYLKNKGEVQAYSIRTHNLLLEQKSKF